jgi:dienelactone hydrolase
VSEIFGAHEHIRDACRRFVHAGYCAVAPELFLRQGDVAASLTAPVLGLYGGKDQGIALDSVERMRSALASGHSGSEIVVYPDAPHAFHAGYRASYGEDAASDGWARALARLAAHGAAPSA